PERARGAARMLLRPSAGYSLGLASAAAAALALVFSTQVSLQPPATPPMRAPERIASGTPSVLRTAPRKETMPVMSPNDVIDMLAPSGSSVIAVAATPRSSSPRRRVER